MRAQTDCGSWDTDGLSLAAAPQGLRADGEPGGIEKAPQAQEMELREGAGRETKAARVFRAEGQIGDSQETAMETCRGSCGGHPTGTEQCLVPTLGSHRLHRNFHISWAPGRGHSGYPRLLGLN